MTLHFLFSWMAFMALASGKAQIRPDNWIPQPTKPTSDFRSSNLQLNRQRRPDNWIPQPTKPTPDLRFSDYEETDSEDLQLNRQQFQCQCQCPEPKSQNRMLSQSETELLEGNEDKDYQFSTFHPGAHQFPGPYSGYKPSRRLSLKGFNPRNNLS